MGLPSQERRQPKEEVHPDRPHTITGPCANTEMNNKKRRTFPATSYRAPPLAFSTCGEVGLDAHSFTRVR